MARLEALHRGIDIGVEGFRNAGAGRQIARNHQALAQRHDIGIDHAELQLLGRRHHRPAALRDDTGILGDRLLDVENGLQREDRQVGRDLVALAGARVERIVPIAAAFRLQDFGDHVLGADRAGESGRGQRACAGKEETSARFDRHSRYSSRRWASGPGSFGAALDSTVACVNNVPTIRLKPAAAQNAPSTHPGRRRFRKPHGGPSHARGSHSEYGGSMAFATHDNVKPAKRKRPLLFSNGRFGRNDWRVGSYIR